MDDKKSLFVFIHGGRMTKPAILAIAAACALQGCIQYSDTVNRAQFSSFAAAGGHSADTPMFADTMAGNIYPAAETAAQSGVHPHIAYFFEKLCAGSSPEDPPCNPGEGEVVYQDKDVALVTTANLPAFVGSGGYDINLLDLKGKPGSILYHNATGEIGKVTRKGQRITINYAQRFHGKQKKVIDLNKKPRAVNMCEIYGC